MVAEPIVENRLCRASPPTGWPVLCSSSHSSLSSLSTGQQQAEFNTTRATHRHSGTVHSTVHWTTLGYAHWESQQGLGKQLSFPLSLCTLLFSYSSAPLSFTVPTLNSLSLSIPLLPSLSLPLVCQDCLYFWKSSTSPSLAGTKQTTSAAGGLLQLCYPPSKLYNEA